MKIQRSGTWDEETKGLALNIIELSKERKLRRTCKVRIYKVEKRKMEKEKRKRIF